MLRLLSAGAVAGLSVLLVLTGALTLAGIVWSEAIVTAIGRSDETTDTNVRGTAFERVDAFRKGVLGGLPVCQSS